MKKWQNSNCKYQAIVIKNRIKREARHSCRKKKKGIVFVRIEAPKCFRILQEYDRRPLVKFTDKIRHIITSTSNGVSIDFSNTDRMIVDGTLFFLAVLCQLQRTPSSKQRFRCKLGENSKVNQVLKQIGALEKLNCLRNVTPVDEDVVNWSVAEGNDVSGEKYEEIMGRYDGNIAVDLSKGFYNGITEAMTNTKQHAYLNLSSGEVDNPDAQAPWWMLSQQRNGWLSVCFADLGVGIPATLKQTERGKTILSDLWRVMRKPSHGSMIKEAALRSNSRTELDYRGKGLPQMASILNGIERSELFIFSSRGAYKRTDNSEGESKTFKTELRGTMIFWKVPLGEET